jgi:hypothetical protein
MLVVASCWGAPRAHHTQGPAHEYCRPPANVAEHRCVVHLTQPVARCNSCGGGALGLFLPSNYSFGWERSLYEF